MLKRFLLVIISAASLTLFGQEEKAQDVFVDNDTIEIQVPTVELKVGVFNEIPFVFNREGIVDGYSIRLWERMAKELDLNYEYVQFETFEELKESTIAGDIDIAINPITVSAIDFTDLDFTQPIIISNLAIAISAEKSGLLTQLFRKMMTWEFLAGVILMGLVILIFGSLAWIFERRHNRDQFGNNPQGLWDSFWWSAVTMTTVGYGDKAPKTIGGRLIAIIWMFTAVIIVASYTATISSSLTLDELSLEINSLNDLRTSKILVESESAAETYLKNLRIPFIEIDDPIEALRMVESGDAEAFVADEALIRFLFETEEFENTLTLAPAKFYKQYYAFALPLESEYLGPINLALIKTIQSEYWKRELARYQVN